MLQSVNDLKGDDIISTNGKIGSIEEFYFEDTNLAVCYVVANTGNWLTGFARRLCVTKKNFADLDDDQRTIRN
ncbi:MAG: PRC-barrel domain-containing protein [Actinomycetota bacterium]